MNGKKDLRIQKAKMSLFISLFVLVSLSSCNQSSDKSKSHIYRILRNRQIVKTTFEQPNDSVNVNNFSIVNGNDLVFSYNHIPQTDPASRKSYSESIVFQINPNLTNFHYQDAQIDSIHGFYMQDSDTLIQESIKDGEITGKRVNDTTWNVHLSVKVRGQNGLMTRTLNHNFVVQKIK